MNPASTDPVPPADQILSDAELEEVTAGKVFKELVPNDMEGPKGWFARLPSKVKG